MGVQRLLAIWGKLAGMALGTSLAGTIAVAQQPVSDLTVNVPERGAAYGLPFAQGSDGKMFDARVELYCLDGSPLPADPTHFFFTAAYHPDYPLRTAFFGVANSKLLNIGSGSSEVTYEGDGNTFLGDSGANFGDPAVWYVSAQLFVVVPEPREENNDALSVFPVVPGFSQNILTVRAGNRRLDALTSYRIDCEFPNQINEAGALRATRPLVRSDFLPSIEIEARQKAQRLEIDSFLVDAFSGQSDPNKLPELSDFFLLSGDLHDQFKAWFGAPGGVSLGRYLDFYVDSTNASEGKFFPQFLPNDSQATVEMRLPASAKDLLIGNPKLNQHKFVGPPDATQELDTTESAQSEADRSVKEEADFGEDQNAPPETEPAQKDEFKYKVELKGKAFGEVSRNLKAFAIGDGGGKCQATLFDGNAFPSIEGVLTSIESVLTCDAVPADIHLFSIDSDATGELPSLRLRAITGDEIDAGSIDVSSADVTVLGFELRPDESFDVSVQKRFSDIALDALFGSKNRRRKLFR